MMTVDNRVILRGEVEDDFNARLKATYPGGTDVRTKALLFQKTRFDFLRAAVQSQSAWSIRGSTPDRIQKILEKEMERRTKKQIQGAGSLNKMRQDMGLLSTSAYIRERREREDILLKLAEQDMMFRLRDRLALMITPSMLRKHYARRRPEMQSTGSVDLELVIVDGAAPGADQKAKEAVKLWTGSLLTGKEVAAKVGGVALAQKTGDPLQPFLVEFMKKPAGSVSPPIRKGTKLYVLKVVNRSAGNEFRWEDPAVQNFLRDELTRIELDRIDTRMRRERQKTLKIWPPLDRGRQ